MVFKIILSHIGRLPAAIPVNYTYPLSAALYRIIAKGDAQYASFLHERGYGKGFKFFTFSQINCPFTIEGDRMHLLHNELYFHVAFHLPLAAENFVKGLFQSEHIDIADKKSRASFAVQSVESLPNPLQQYKDNEIVSVRLSPLSPIVAGLQNEKGQYEFLSPEDPRFAESVIYNWRSKMTTCYGEPTAKTALLIVEIGDKKSSPNRGGGGGKTLQVRKAAKSSPKSRLITIKAGTPGETKIRGWMNFRLKVTAEKRFVELLLNAGAGVYNSMGCGCVEVVA